MTEIDTSPEAYARHLATQTRISNWVSNTEAHRPPKSSGISYENPFKPSNRVLPAFYDPSPKDDEEMYSASQVPPRDQPAMQMPMQMGMYPGGGGGGGREGRHRSRRHNVPAPLVLHPMYNSFATPPGSPLCSPGLMYSPNPVYSPAGFPGMMMSPPAMGMGSMPMGMGSMGGMLSPPGTSFPYAMGPSSSPMHSPVPHMPMHSPHMSMHSGSMPMHPGMSPMHDMGMGSDMYIIQHGKSRRSRSRKRHRDRERYAGGDGFPYAGGGDVRVIYV